MIETKILSDNDPAAIPAVQQVLAGGGLVVFPTDTVYGLAAGLWNPAAIARLYEAKERSANKAIAVLIGAIEQLQQVTPGLTPSASRLAQRFWPGALTLVVPKHPDLPENLSALPTVGVRMPNHNFARALLRAAGPLATTSANISGAVNPKDAQEVFEQLAGRVELIIDGGALTGGVPSTVVDCTTDDPRILREGAIAAQAILGLFSAPGG